MKNVLPVRTHPRCVLPPRRPHAEHTVNPLVGFDQPSLAHRLERGHMPIPPPAFFLIATTQQKKRGGGAARHERTGCPMTHLFNLAMLKHRLQCCNAATLHLEARGLPAALQVPTGPGRRFWHFAVAYRLCLYASDLTDLLT